MSVAAAAEDSLQDGDPAAALAQLQEEVRAKPGGRQAAGLPVPAAVRARSVGARAQPAEGRVRPRRRRAGDGADVRRGGALRSGPPRGVRRPQVADDLRRAGAVAGAADRIAAASPGRGEAGAVRRAAAARLRGGAEPRPATLNGQPFEWIADADSRLGPVLEAVINGRYYWVPFSRLPQVTLEAPEDLRDLVWMPAHLQFENGGESVALIPTRYPGSEAVGDGADRTRAQDDLGGAGRRRAPRPRPARAGHRRRRRAAAGRPRADRPPADDGGRAGRGAVDG